MMVVLRRFATAVAVGLVVAGCAPAGDPTVSPSPAGTESTAATSTSTAGEPSASAEVSGLWAVVSALPADAVLTDSFQDADGAAGQTWKVSEDLTLTISRDVAIEQADDAGIVAFLESRGLVSPQLHEVTGELDDTQLSYPAYQAYAEADGDAIYQLLILTDQWTFVVGSTIGLDSVDSVEPELEKLLKSVTVQES